MGQAKAGSCDITLIELAVEHITHTLENYPDSPEVLWKSICKSSLWTNFLRKWISLEGKAHQG